MELPILTTRVIAIHKTEELPAFNATVTLRGRKYLKSLTIKCADMTFAGFVDTTNLDSVQFIEWSSVNFHIYGIILLINDKEYTFDLVSDKPSTRKVSTQEGSYLRMMVASSLYAEVLDELDTSSDTNDVKNADILLKYIRLIKLTNAPMLSMLEKQDRENLLQSKVTSLELNVANLAEELESTKKSLEEAQYQITSLKNTRASYKEELKKATLATIDQFQFDF